MEAVPCPNCGDPACPCARLRPDQECERRAKERLKAWLDDESRRCTSALAQLEVALAERDALARDLAGARERLLSASGFEDPAGRWHAKVTDWNDAGPFWTVVIGGERQTFTGDALALLGFVDKALAPTEEG